MKAYITGLTLLLLGLSCNAQESREKAAETATPEQTTQEVQPKVNWKVNKETDEYGNVIRYDSIYSWSYSNKVGDPVEIDVDSLMQSFNGYMSERLPGFWKDHYWSPFDRDSLWRNDFWEEDFFRDRWERDLYNLDPLFKRMDSLRNRFLRDHYPERNPQQEIKHKI